MRGERGSRSSGRGQRFRMLFYVPALVAVIGGIWAVVRIRRPDIRDRPDRSVAIRLVAALAVVAGLGIGVLAAFSALIFAPNQSSAVVGLISGVIGGACCGLAGILGYALLARPRIGRIAIAGAILGPVLLIAATNQATIIASSGDLAALDEKLAQHNSEIAARSAALHVTVDVTKVQLGREGAVVAAVNLRVRLSTDVPVILAPGRHDPCFVLFPPDPKAAMYLDNCAPPDAATRLMPGQTYEYLESFRYPVALVNETEGTYRAGPPGLWRLRIDALDTAEQEYDVWVPVELR